MKKFLILMLALVLCLSSFVACENDDQPKETTEESVDTALALKNATAYVKNMYKNLLTENKTGTDFDLVSSVKVSGVDYTVTWTVDNDAVKVVEGEDKVTINVDENSAAEVAYNLTAVVSAADGTKGDPLTFKLVVPSANFMTIPEALEAPDGELVTVSGTVTLINTPWDDGYKNISVTIEDEAGNQLYLYRLAANVALGDIITVKGTMATYNGARQIAQGGTAEITGHVDVTLDYKELTIPEVIASDDNTLVIVKGTVKTVDTPWSDNYGNISVTIVDENGNELYIYRLATKVELGDILTIKGLVGSYNGNKQIAQGATAEITGHTDVKVEYNTISIADALASEDGTLVAVKGTVVTIDTAWSDNYGNISVTIEDEAGNQLYLYRLATKVEVGDVIVVKGKMDTYKDERQIAQGATAEIVGKEDINVEYTEVTISEALEAKDGALVIVKGTVMFTEAWSEQYKNMNVTITDENGNQLYIYRLPVQVEVGDIVRVQGKMDTYGGKRQIAQGSTAEITGHTDIEVEYPEVTFSEALVAKDGSLVCVKGTVQEIDTPWSEDYGNMSVSIIDADGNQLYIYRLASQVELGDIVTVKGVMGTYNEARQIAAGATAEVTGQVTIDYEHLSIREILDSDKSLYVYVTGTVDSVKTDWNYKSENMSVYIVDENGDRIYVHQLASHVNRFDVITVKGKAVYYEKDETMRIAGGGTAEVIGRNEPTFTQMSVADAKNSTGGTFVEIEGIVKEVDPDDWGTDYRDIDIVITDGKGTELKVNNVPFMVFEGDILNIKGEITSSSGKQIAKDAIIELVGSYQILTVAEALEAEVDTPVIIKGTVTDVPNPGEWDNFGNQDAYISDGTGTIKCYRLKTKVAVGDEITVYGNIGEHNDTKQIAAYATAEVKKEYKEYTVAEALTAEVGSLAILKGVVTSIDEAWSDQYSNISVYISDGTDTIKCYRLSTKVAVGDAITVHGEIDNYNNTNQIAKGATAEITGSYETVTIEGALAANDDTLVIVEGTVKLVNTEWNDTDGNMSVTITDGNGKDIYVYNLTTKVAVDDVITVYGKIATVEGDKQINDGFAEIKKLRQTVTIAEALALEQGTLVSVSGIVKSVDTPWSTTYNNITVTIIDKTGSTIQCYRLATNVKVGDAITVEGAIKGTSTKQIDKDAIAIINGSHTVVTIPEALAATENDLVIVKGTVKSAETWNTTYSNMDAVIVDTDGNEIKLYRLATKVEVGDQLIVYGKIGVHNSINQIAAGGFAEIEEVTITPSAPTFEGYTKVTSIAVGDKIVLSYIDETKNTYVEFNGINNKIGQYVDVTTTFAPKKLIEVVAGSTSDSFAFKVGENEYLAWTSGLGNKITTVTSVDATSSWTITANADNSVVIKNVGSTDETRVIQFNANAGQERFCCYKGTQKSVTLWKQNSAE